LSKTRRLIAAFAVGCLMSLAVPSVALAQPPSRGCPPPESGFTPITVEAAIQLGLSLGLPAEEVPNVVAVLQAIDANDDNVLCIRAFPEAANRPPYLFNLIDNIANA
jgi:hypothetical protein